MTKQVTYVAQEREDGYWESRREGAKRPSGVFVTKGGAWEYTKDLARIARSEAILKSRSGGTLEHKVPKWYDFLEVI